MLPRFQFSNTHGHNFSCSAPGGPSGAVPRRSPPNGQQPPAISSRSQEARRRQADWTNPERESYRVGPKVANWTKILTEMEFEKFIQEKTGMQYFSFSRNADLFGGAEEGEKLGEKDKEAESATLWTDIYRPRSLNDIVGN